MTVKKQPDRSAVIRAAARAWNASKPHRALEILIEAGYRDMWPEFQRRALRVARRRYMARMDRAAG